MDPTTSSSFLSNKRNLIALGIVLLLLVAIPLGVYLAQKTQIFKPRADTGTAEPIKFSGTGVTKNSDGSYTTTTPTVDLELTSPFGPPSQ